MDKHVLYVRPSMIDLVINEENLERIFGGLPPKPKSRLIYLEDVIKGGLTKSDGSPFETRYTIDGPLLSFPKYERCRIMVIVREDEEGNLFATYDTLAIDDGPINPETDRSGPSSVVVPLEFRDGVWYAHAHIQYRETMEQWTLNTVGGFKSKLGDTEGSLNIEIGEEFGEVEILHSYLDTTNERYGNRTRTLNGNYVGWFVFDDATWEVSDDPGGFEVFAKQRLAIPLEEYTSCPDNIAHVGLSFAQACLRKGMLKDFEK